MPCSISFALFPPCPRQRSTTTHLYLLVLGLVLDLRKAMRLVGPVGRPERVLQQHRLQERSQRWRLYTLIFSSYYAPRAMALLVAVPLQSISGTPFLSPAFLSPARPRRPPHPAHALCDPPYVHHWEWPWGHCAPVLRPRLVEGHAATRDTSQVFVFFNLAKLPKPFCHS